MEKERPRPPRKVHDRHVLLQLLRQVRLDAGLRQEDLAQVLGRKQAYVSKYELGERRLDLLELIAVCDAVGLPFPEFAKRFEKERLLPTR